MVTVILPLNLYIARRQHGLQRFILKMKGKRVRLINEILSGIKVFRKYPYIINFNFKICLFAIYLYCLFIPSV